MNFLNGWQTGWSGTGHTDVATAGAIDFQTQPAPEKPGAHWTDFQDAELAALLQLAENNNDDLMIAKSRIEQARADERGAVAALLPQVNGSTTLTRQTMTPPLQDQLDTSNQIGFNGSWDLDLAGGNKRKLEASRAGIEAAEQDRAQTELMMQAEIARNYIELRSNQQQYKITQQNLEMQNYALTVTAAQRELGAISDFELARAKAQVQDTAARLPPLQKAMDAAINRLSVLTDSAPQTLQPMLMETKPIPNLSATAVVGMPLDVIAHRPDVHGAERRLAQAAALRNAAFADYFPKISLQGFWGRQHSDFFGGGSLWSAAINGALPILDFGAIRSQVNLADAKQKEAFYTYRQTVFRALEDTDNAITAYLTEIQRRDHLRQEAESFDKAAEIALEQYKVGTATQLDLLVAERDKLDADTQLAVSDAAVAENLILLYRALGENWEEKLASGDKSVKSNDEHHPVPISLKSPDPIPTIKDTQDNLKGKVMQPISIPMATPSDGNLQGTVTIE
jgi:multidrug efflux system outer membrane protein